MKYLATTCLVSEVSKPRQKPHVLEFIAKNTFVFSPETLIDVQRGILRTSRTNPQKAAELREWLSSVSGSWPLVSGREQEKAKLVAAMLECRELKNIWLPQPKAAHPGFGYHVSIAAAAIAYELPLAGFGIDTFLQIDRYFGLPGIFDLKMKAGDPLQISAAPSIGNRSARSCTKLWMVGRRLEDGRPNQTARPPDPLSNQYPIISHGNG